MFYWKHQEKRAAPFKYMKRFRQETPGQFSDRHRAHIHVYASQDEELRHRLKDYEIYGCTCCLSCFSRRELFLMQ